jgi:O-antigen/teichoic acid export membrane protein
MAVTAPELVELLFGKAWARSGIYMTVFALLTLVRLFKNLARPLLTAVGRPQDSMFATGVEMVVMVVLIAVTGARSTALVLGIWAVREVAAVPVVAVVIQRTAKISYVDQFRGTVPALAGSIGIVIATCGIRRLLPPDGSALTRLAELVPAGAAAFLLCAYLVDRSSLDHVVGFVASALTRHRSQPGQPGRQPGPS